MKTYLDLDEASEKYELDPDHLRELAREGQIRTGQYGDKLLLLEDDVANEAARMIDKAEFAHLEGEVIGAGEAARKYGFSMTSILQWAAKGHLRIEGHDGPKVLLNEADVAYAHKLAKVKKLKRGQKLFPD
jgi:hypothetical protein